jgi:endogenous inhibitor of DNA gyrase (YacG/DUF329 family)
VKLRCPTCKKRFERSESSHAPFCSERCKLIDLGKWFDESYRIPGEPAPLPDDRDREEEPDG